MTILCLETITSIYYENSHYKICSQEDRNRHKNALKPNIEKQMIEDKTEIITKTQNFFEKPACGFRRFATSEIRFHGPS